MEVFKLWIVAGLTTLNCSISYSVAIVPSRQLPSHEFLHLVSIII